MKKSTHHFHLSENGKVALLAIGFLSFIMLLTYLYWYA
jgi:hypothetical protein